MTTRMKSKLNDDIFEQMSAKRIKLNHLLSQQLELEEELKQLKCQYNNFNGINSLPFEVLCLILKRVPLQDLLQCELVCHQWSEVVKNLKIEEAVIAKRDEVPNYWYHNEQPVQPGSIMVRSDLNFEHFESSFLLAIKRLKICNSSDDPERKYRTPYVPLLESVEFLNGLIELEVLEIGRYPLDETDTLSLPKLKYLAIRNLDSEFKLDCPSLQQLRIDNCSWYPDDPFKEKITHLNLGGSDSAHWKSELFNNLQYLSWRADNRFCHEAKLPTNRTLQMLSARPKVSKYHYKDCKDTFLEFLKKKKKAGRNDLKLVFFGVLLEDAAQLENLNDEDDNFKDLTLLQMRNYDKLCEEELHWIKIMNYSTVMRCIDDGTIESVPADLHQRFDRVREVCVDAKVEDEEHLLAFLRKFRRFDKFSVSVAPLGADFYERLAVEFPQIRKLSLCKATTATPQQQLDDLSFIFKFPNLIELTTISLEIKNEFILKLFNIFPVFKLTFTRAGSETTYKREHPSMRLEYVTDEPRDFYDVHELVEHHSEDDSNKEEDDSEESDEEESDRQESDEEESGKSGEEESDSGKSDGESDRQESDEEEEEDDSERSEEEENGSQESDDEQNDDRESDEEVDVGHESDEEDSDKQESNKEEESDCESDESDFD